MANDKLRLLIIQSGVRQWQIAESLNVSEASFSKMLRSELPEEKLNEIIAIIKRLKGGK